MSLINETEQVRADRAKLLQHHLSDAGALSRAGSSNVEGHLQRWAFELLQNAEDACADTCEIILRGDLLVVADNGKGLRNESVKALSTPFESDKTGSRSIGRKGVGFSAVYDLTRMALG